MRRWGGDSVDGTAAARAPPSSCNGATGLRQRSSRSVLVQPREFFACPKLSVQVGQSPVTGSEPAGGDDRDGDARPREAVKALIRGRDLEPGNNPSMSVAAPQPAMKAGLTPPH